MKTTEQTLASIEESRQRILAEIKSQDEVIKDARSKMGYLKCINDMYAILNMTERMSTTRLVTTP